MNNNNKLKGGGGEGGSTPPAQLGGLGEHRKLPQTPTLFYYIMLKTLHKTACKTELVYIFHKSNNSAI